MALGSLMGGTPWTSGVAMTERGHRCRRAGSARAADGVMELEVWACVRPGPRFTRRCYQALPAATRLVCGVSSRTTGTVKACETGRRRAVTAGTVIVVFLAIGGACDCGVERCA